MNIIPTSTTSFEVIVNNFINQGKISTLEALGKLLERIDKLLYSQKQPFEKVIKIKERTIQTSIGMLRFKRRYYYDELEHKYRFLLDAYLNIPRRNRLMDNVKIKIIEAASEMSYEKAGRYACEEGLPVSKAAVCRLIRNTEFFIEDNNSLIINDSKVHVQIDEKFINVIGSANKKKLYTCTIFKGVIPKGKKKVLQNRTLISSKNLNLFFEKINKSLFEKYHIKLDDEIYVSGDLASYIQKSPEKILVCKAIYVPDKFHVLKAIKDSLGLKTNKYLINDGACQKLIIDSLKGINDVDASKIRTLLSKNPESLTHYLDYEYDGCSQECMNSHYFCSRFDKVPNIWRFDTIEKLSQVICSKQNRSVVKIGWKDKYYKMPYDTIEPINVEKEYRNGLDEMNLPHHMRRFFYRLEDGWDIIP